MQRGECLVWQEPGCLKTGGEGLWIRAGRQGCGALAGLWTGRSVAGLAGRGSVRGHAGGGGGAGAACRRGVSCAWRYADRCLMWEYSIWHFG